MRSPLPAVFLSALLGLFLVLPGYAFHSCGVAECGGCHSMHGPNPAGSSLLTGSDPSSTCLSCHGQD
jgi:predicted CXXCH cytochrome family protein